MTKGRILVVEDEPIALENLTRSLTNKGHDAVAAASGAMALLALETDRFDLVITDIRMPDVDGMQLLEQVKRSSPDTEVIVLTGYASVEAAVDAMRKGAFQYLAKPVRLDEVALVVERALEKNRLKKELSALQDTLREGSAPTIIGHSPQMRDLKHEIARIGPVDCTVLLQGDTGTGKELAARSLHALSQRAGNRFMAVNCASLAGDLMTNELFGHEKDAFTGARSQKKGLIETADKGTLFLDEMGDMPMAMQAQLLRVLESGTLIRVGGTAEVPVDLRIIAATNRDLPRMVEEGTFRKDLFYRLNVFTIHLPPLRERNGDVPLLAAFFVNRFAKRLGKSVAGIDDDALELLAGYDFPGNVRELEHIMERAVVLCGGDSIGIAHLPPELSAGRQLRIREAPEFRYDGIVTLEENERRYLSWVLEQTGGVKSRTADLLGINRGSLWRKLKRFGL